MNGLTFDNPPLSRPTIELVEGPGGSRAINCTPGPITAAQETITATGRNPHRLSVRRRNAPLAVALPITRIVLRLGRLALRRCVWAIPAIVPDWIATVMASPANDDEGRMSAIAALVLCASPVVHDGDSIRCGRERVRIENIDAPELPDSPKCHPVRGWCDTALAEASREALREFLGRGPVMIRRTGVDPYGRTLARVTVNGSDAGTYLVGLGLARWWR